MSERRREARRAEFDAITRGVHPYKVARAMSQLTPGIDWRGSGRPAMREAFVDGETLGWRFRPKPTADALRGALAACGVKP